jgi:hypothetical protein
MGWKKFAKNEKGITGQVDRESHVDGGFFFLILRILCIMNCYIGHTVNRWYYLRVLNRVRENVRSKRPQFWRNNSWFLHHDSAPAHASLLICDSLANTNTTVLPQPPYSPDLAQADFLISQIEIYFERMTISDD